MSYRGASLFRIAALLAAGLFSAAGALAQTRTIKFIVPLTAGGPNDTVARLTAEHVSRTQGVAMVIENRPGAGTIIGTELVARAAPDGNTILMAAGSFVVNPHVRKLSYDPLTSFEPVCFLVRSPQVLVSPASSPWKTLAEFIEAARKRPEEIMVAGNGPATSQHISFAMLQHAASVKMTFVPFTGDAPTLNAVLGDQISAAILDYVTVAEYVKLGKLRVLAAGTQQRIDKIPDVPTFAELGFKDFDWAGTFGVMAPAKTPPEKVAELSRWFKAALDAPDVRGKLDNMGLYPVGACGADYGAFLSKQLGINGRVIREANIKAE